MTYLDTDLLESAKRTELPKTRQTATGYGSMIPTQYMVRVCGTPRRWQRIYCMIFSNSGSLYIIRHGRRCFLDAGAMAARFPEVFA